MKKRILGVLLVFTMLLNVVNIPVIAKYISRDYEKDGFLYKIYDDFDNYTEADYKIYDNIGYARIWDITDELSGDVVVPNSVQNIPTLLDKAVFLSEEKCGNITTLVLPENTLTLPVWAFGGCMSLTDIYIPSGVVEINNNAFRQSNNSLWMIPKLKNIYFGGSEEEWNSIQPKYPTSVRLEDGRKVDSMYEVVKVHFNCKGIEKSPQENKTAYSLSVSPSAGIANKIIGRDQYGAGIYQDGTGTLFTFTAVTSSNVNAISICGDKPDETKWHEISYEYLKNNYGLYSYDNGDGTKTWVCKFYINEPNHAQQRTFKVKVDGMDTNAVAYVNVSAQNTLANDTKVDLPAQGGGFGSQQETNVTVNGKKVNFDVPPQIINGRTMIPVRAVAEAFGATVDWDQNRGVAEIRGYNKYKSAIRICYVEIGSNSMAWETEGAWLTGGEGGYKELDAPAVIIDGRTLVPIRAIAEVFGYDVEWDNNTRTVIIK